MPVNTRGVHLIIRVALDTRLPASYGPDRHYPPQLQHQATCIFQRSLVQTLAENPGFSNSESPLFSLSETIDLCIRTKLRMCGTFLHDRTRQESSIERHRTCLAAPVHPCTRGIPFIPQGTLSTSSWSHLVLNISASGRKVPHSLSFPNNHRFSTSES